MDMKKFSSCFRAFLTPVILILLGLLLVVQPDWAAGLLARVLGWLLALGGGYFLLRGIFSRDARMKNLLAGVICLGLGIFLIGNPLAMAAGLGRLTGLFLLIRGGVDVFLYGSRNQWVTALLGLVLLLLPMATSRIVFTLCGLALLVYGIFTLAVRIHRLRLEKPEDPNIIDAL